MLRPVLDVPAHLSIATVSVIGTSSHKPDQTPCSYQGLWLARIAGRYGGTGDVMGEVTSFKYNLPRTDVLITGTIRRRHDSVLDAVGTKLGKAPPKLVSHSIELRHIADGIDRNVRVPAGMLRSYKGSFAFTSDHRLTSVTVESTGQVGTILTAAAKLAGTAIALGLATLAVEDTVKGPTPQDRVEAAYEHAHPAEAQSRKELLEQRRTARTEIIAATKIILGNKDDDDSSRQKVRRLKEAQAIVQAELVPLEAHFAAWRAGTIKEIDESFDLQVDLKDIPTRPVAEWPAPASHQHTNGPASLDDLWDRFGVGLRAIWKEDRKTTQQVASEDTGKIFTRRPDPLILEVIELKESFPVVTKRSRHLIVDSHSDIESFKIKKSIFGRNSLNLTFNSDGFLTGVGTEGDAALATAAGALAQLPGDLASGIETGTKVRTGVSAAQRAGLEAELSRVKQEVELRQQRILAAGLDATEGDAVAVERLKQMQAIIESQTIIRDADPSLIAALKETAADDLRWYRAPTPAPEEGKTITVIVKQDRPEGGPE